MQNVVPDNYQLDNIIGYGFRPTDEELVDHYLVPKLQGNDPRVHVMPEINLCDVEPWDVPVMLADSVIRFKDPEWFFFSRIDYKYSNSRRVNRKTKFGYWKTTGKERDVRSTDTNNVIGTKKTLVFYKGRFPNGVKSNWVIHEYHDATSHESQRTFVLCRLIKKPEKTAEEGADALICDEGEPNRSIIAEYENQATTDNCCYPIQQTTIGIGQEEVSAQNSPFNNAYFENENNIMQISFPITEEEGELFNSILVDKDNMYAFVNSSTQLESLMLYCESSDTDAEVISKQDGDFMDTSIVCNDFMDTSIVCNEYLS